MSDETTFHAGFEGASVTIKLDYAAFQKRKNIADVLNAKWDGQPTPKIFPQYISWMHTVMAQVAQRINEDVCYAYPPSPGGRPQFYIYHRDGTYERFQPPQQRG